MEKCIFVHGENPGRRGYEDNREMPTSGMEGAKRKGIEIWTKRKRREMDFCLIQALSGHGCFNKLSTQNVKRRK
jgi:hypothetical protein